MNKQILIDDVDVSGCEHVRITKTFFREKTYIQCSAFFLENEDSYCDCTDNPNCNYKQLKAKEQECEALHGYISRLEEELEIEEAEAIRAEVIMLEKTEEADKLKQALTEIKQLLEDALDTDKTNAEQSFGNFYKAIKLCEVLDEQI